MEDIKIRIIEEKDCKELSRLKREIWETTYRGIYPDEKLDKYDFVDNENKFKIYVENKTKHLYVLIDNNIIIGYVEFGEPNRPFREYKQEIGLFYIKQEYQNKGLGKKLFELAYTNILKTGVDKFFISCNKYNENAKKFYTKMGGRIVQEDDSTEESPQVKFEYIIQN